MKSCKRSSHELWRHTEGGTMLVSHSNTSDGHGSRAFKSDLKRRRSLKGVTHISA
ncbi:hypothetical protein IQ266_01750 [filamentous cyanobacterium LEGE 11480]|uniref:Uncharacterized protein n=2 Tax=Romeriopsis TaxID=2992131 RepID=A0A928VMC0_9CYAN|nr:hypothetical protein [Romeriopsis navalis LEGE 11480]